ncbi:MAG: FHA domain-containing protein, partial [Phycisphaerae bacterium]|nr:FHA domain-containing protein [Phycisphaerae bacterium]
MTRLDSSFSDASKSQDSGAASLRLCIEGGAEPRTVTFDSVREIVVGRDATALVRLPHDAVSRQHLRLFQRDGRWFAEDLGSRHGTMVDGVLLSPRRPIPVGHSATILVRPFALRLESGSISESTRGLRPHLADRDDSSLVRTLNEEELGSLNGRRLALLLQAAEAINSARDERGVAEAATDALITGTGFARALALRWSGSIESLETLAVRIGSDADAVPSARVSSTMLKAAASGSPVRLEDVAAIREAESIAGSGVAAALCAPIVVPPLVEAFLYLDSQRRSARPNPDAAAFCHLVAKLSGLALGNLRRMAAEQRQRDLEQKLDAARHAQSSLLPAERGERDGCRWRLFMRPGLLVAGDIAGVHG